MMMLADDSPKQAKPIKEESKTYWRKPSRYNNRVTKGLVELMTISHPSFNYV